VLEELRAWVLALVPTVEPKSTLGEGLTYLQLQWLRLCLFVFDGEIEVTNNASERALRPWALGRHTWLFVGDQVHAKRWAAAYTLCATALAQGLNPRAYLHAVVGEADRGTPAHAARRAAARRDARRRSRARAARRAAAPRTPPRRCRRDFARGVGAW
jgi:hypothetical protein